MSEWTDKDGLRAIVKMGWPQWEDDAGHQRKLKHIECTPGLTYFIADGPIHRPCVCEGKHEALCILRDHARRWLQDKMGDLVIYAPGATTDEGLPTPDGWTVRCGATLIYESAPTLDAALIAAVLAVKQ